MQKSFTTFMLAFVAGLLGAWTYQQFFLTDLSLAGHPSADTQFTSHQINNFTESNAPTTSGKANGLPVSFVEASERSTESVVFIKNFSGTDYRRYSIFDYFFGPQGGSPQRVSTGSGVIFSEDGYIITNNHVVEDAETLEVIHQKKTYKAKLIGTDPNTDIAVLKVDAEGLQIGRAHV